MNDGALVAGGERETIGTSSAGRRRLGFVACAVVVLVAGAVWLARAMATPDAAPRSWVDGVAQLGVDRFSIEYDGWTYGSNLQVLSWIDRSGTWHDGGVPTCLRTEPGASVPVRFQAREVTVDGQTWRPIVALACR